MIFLYLQEIVTPVLTCEPHGLKFSKDVQVSLPTCYKTSGKTPVIAEVNLS